MGNHRGWIRLAGGTAIRAGAWLVLGCAIAAYVLLAPPAHAARGISLGFAEPNFLSKDQATRSTWLQRGAAAGSEWARIGVGWRGIAPSKPLLPGNPASPELRWEQVDAAVRAAAAHGQKVMFTPTSAPDWAEGPNRPAAVRPGTWKPDPKAFADFGHALATRYSGSYPDPLHPGRTLPQVRHFEVWNEPNLENFLSPQRVGNNVVSPSIYRTMLNAFYRAVHSVQRDAVVIAGGLAPIGSEEPRDSLGPIDFLQRLLCVDGGAGETKTAEPCDGRFALMDVLGHHPINIVHPPDQAMGLDDAGIAEMSDLTEMLRAAEAAGTVPGGPHPVWATEFWWYSNPPFDDPAIPTLAEQARYIEQGIYLLWKQGIDVAIYFQLVDDPTGHWRTGLYHPGGRPKPSLTAFRFPLVGDRVAPRKVLAWGRAPRDGVVRLRSKSRAGGWRLVARFPVARGQVFTRVVPMRGPGQLQARMGTASSLVWSQAG